MEETCSERLASFIGRIDFPGLPHTVVQMAKSCLLDWLGCVVAARNEDSVQKVSAVAGIYGGRGKSTIIPTLERSSSLLASFINGAAAHALEMDDVHRDSVTHPACVVIPAVFAVGEREKIGGKKLIEAIVSGYEIMIRVGEAVGRSHYTTWHNTSTCGTFGAAAGAGKVLGLTRDQHVHALGNAGSQSAGLWEFLEDGADTKFMHAGKAAMNGIIASDLAAQGFTGARRIFEGKRGFFTATSTDARIDKLIEELDGKEPFYRILTDSFKFYPSCRHTHSPIDATLKLVSEYNIKPEDVEQVDVCTYSAAIDLCGEGKVTNPYRAKFNIPFTVATAILYRSVWLESFTDSRVSSRHLLNLSGRVYVHLDDEYDKLYPSKWPARVTIHLKGSRSVEETVYVPKGDPDNPPADEDLRVKFFNNVRGRLAEESAERIVERIDSLEVTDDMSDFFDDLQLC